MNPQKNSQSHPGNDQSPGAEFLSVPPLMPSRYELQKQLWVARDWIGVLVVIAFCGWVVAGILFALR
jgi:hypothetical protein